MKRRFLLGIGLLGAALVAIPATVIAQSPPPDPPATYYGAATGATAGQGVVAIVVNGSTSTVCGTGEVLLDGGKPVYVVDVVANSQINGCGAAGRTIRFYFTPHGGAGGRLGNETAGWSGAGATKRDLTAGPELQRAGQLPVLASDGALG
ncbi:MAG: hypothetical protein M0R74_14835 [Dehalococcoidia bacterium]|nr:hypothetical protein [Dehalococcoidia bacterium]